MKKVVHIVEAFGGGIFTYLVDLINETIDGYEIIVIYTKREQTPDKFEQYFDKRVKFIESKYLKRNINPLNEICAIKEIRKIIKEIKPDIVHLHSSKAGIIGRVAIKDKKNNVIYNPHGFSFLMQDVSNIKKKMYWIIEKMATFFCPKGIIVGCSKGEYKEALKLTKNSICINNGINVENMKKDISKFDDKQMNFKQIKICTIGRIDYQKNPYKFNEIAKEMPNIKFTWIGDGKLRDILDSKNIKVTGWKSRQEVLKILDEHDIFILTSLWEGLPISLLEAMYMKKICIVSNVIGNKDVIDDKINGFIAYNNKYTDIINSLNSYNLEEIANNAKIDVINNYNFKKNAKMYKELYERGKI